MTAQEFAIAAHGNQKYGKDLPYTAHLTRVVEVLTRFGHRDQTILAAGWLHDTLEDTATRYHDLFMEFGKEVADLVEAVTDKPGKDRRERHQLTYPGLRARGERAVALKLADRIANVEHSLASADVGKLKMYIKEYADFRDFLWRAGELCEMWYHLTDIMARAKLVKKS